MKNYSSFVAMLSSEFHKYLMENEKTAREIPKGALIIFRVNGDENFNKWHEVMSYKNKEKNQSVIYVNVKEWRKQSVIEKLSITKALA